jgi:hypothetical protein
MPVFVIVVVPIVALPPSRAKKPRPTFVSVVSEKVMPRYLAAVKSYAGLASGSPQTKPSVAELTVLPE